MPSQQAGPMFARFLFSDLTAWANRQVRVNNSIETIGRILLHSKGKLRQEFPLINPWWGEPHQGLFKTGEKHTTL
ncbi:MAG: hypothetical protein JNL22_17210 [Bacteroidales bacterium]|nr:hypothetical protein [Bacteroidales bacterium]